MLANKRQKLNFSTKNAGEGAGSTILLAPLLDGSINTSNFVYHPKSVLSGVTSNEGLTNVSLKSATSVNYVVANELLFKTFGLIKEKQTASELVDYGVTNKDVNITNAVIGESKDYQSIISQLQNEVDELLATANTNSRSFFDAKKQNQKDESLVRAVKTDKDEEKPSIYENIGLNLLEEIKNLSKEFIDSTNGETDIKSSVSASSSTGPAGATTTVNSDVEESIGDDGLIISDNIAFHNDKVRSLYEKQFNEKVYFFHADNTNPEIGVSSHLPQVTQAGAADNGLQNHLRVFRLGSIKLIDQEVKPASLEEKEKQLLLLESQPKAAVPLETHKAEGSDTVQSGDQTQSTIPQTASSHTEDLSTNTPAEHS